jgi:hypothetical protein
MKRISQFLALWTLLIQTAGFGADAKLLYENNFDKSEPGKTPEEFLVLDGGFVVKEENGNKILELPGSPLDSFGLLFGPTEKENWTVAARIYGTSKGRRFPTFGVGLNGAGGYKLQVSPGKKAIELYKGDVVKASVDYEWASGKWTKLRLTVQKLSEKEWAVEAKAWTDGSAEPAAAQISLKDQEPPPAGRAMLTGSPFATTPIQYDDLRITTP